MVFIDSAIEAISKVVLLPKAPGKFPKSKSQYPKIISKVFKSSLLRFDKYFREDAVWHVVQFRDFYIWTNTK